MLWLHWLQWGWFCSSIHHGTIRRECKVSSEYHEVVLGKSWFAKRCTTYDMETCLLKLISCGQWHGFKTLPQQPILNKPSSLEEPIPKDDSSLKVESPKALEPSSKEKMHHEDTHDDKMQPKEKVCHKLIMWCPLPRCLLCCFPYKLKTIKMNCLPFHLRRLL